MRRWLLAAGVAAVLSLAFALAQDDQGSCSAQNTAIDVVVEPGAPQDSSVAFRQFLGSAVLTDLPSTSPEDWVREESGGAVTYRLDKTSVHVVRHPNGWAVGAVDTTC